MATKLTPAKRSAEARALLDSPHISALFEKVRLASEPLEETAPQRSSPLPAIIGIGLLSTLIWLSFCGLRSPSLRSTVPGGSHAGNPAIGDTCLYYGDFYPTSGIEPLRQLDVIKSGVNRAGEPGLVARGIAFPIVANLFTVAFDSYYASIALNLVLCWLCAAAVARTSVVLFGDRTKSICAATCFCLSIVATSAVGELGPRLLGILLFYLWTLLLVGKDADDTPIGWRGSIGLAAFLGLWSLVDIGSMSGLSVYAFFAIKRRKLVPLALGAVCWCVVPVVQELIWRKLGLAVAPNADLAHITGALQQQGSRLAADPLGYLAFLAIEFGNLLFAENPFNVLICVVGLGLISHKSKGLLRVCFLAPILVQMVLLPTTKGRGIAIAGNTIVLFVLATHYAVEAGRWLEARISARAFAVPILGLLALQAVWGSASLCGWDFPTHAFGTGAFREAGTVLPTRFVRLSGSPDEIPTVLGGPVRGSRFCAVTNSQVRPPIFPRDRVARYRDNWSGWPSMRRLLAAQTPVFAAVVIATLCLMRFWRGLGAIVLFSSAVAGALLCGASTGFAPQAFASFDSQIRVKEDEKLIGGLRLSPEFQSRLQAAALRDEQIEFFVQLRGVNERAEHPAEFQVAEWSAGEPRFTVPAQALVEAVRARGGRLEFSITASHASRGLLLHSWQTIRNGGARSAQLVRADGTQEVMDRFPSFEIRVLRPNTRYPFSTLIERFDQTHSASYLLVGF
jgi:hypothetical protein